MAAVDILAFGAHPDDVEIGMAATVAKHTRSGRSVGIIDLTCGELGTNGTVADRLAEGLRAARVLGAAFRENLGLPDRGIEDTAAHRRVVVEAIRQHRPQVVCVSRGVDRHPDHVAAYRLVNAACFDSGLRRLEAAGTPHRPLRILYYFINLDCRPDFIVDVSDAYPAKVEALACHSSQFQLGPGQYPTTLNQPGFPRLVRGRDAYFGALIGAEFGEGFVVREPVKVQDLVSLV
ncbi:MAG TPA: bacillithiol biosynthesis deacetylase BshB1 [Clostridiales bacterium UBA8153]|nr:bacillithiol biosynthesis deacetylase BshB1 [Clostridiales bacterium UBA8153]